MARRSERLRAAAVLAVVFLVVSLFVVRLIDVQIVNANTYNEEAEGRRGSSFTVWGSRGEIIASDGTVLADSIDRFDITASPRNATEFERKNEQGETVTVSFDQAIEEIAAATGQQPNDLRQALSDALAQNPNSNFAYLTRMVTLEVYEKVKALEIPWLYFERHPARSYPNGAIAGNLLGFIGSDGSPLAGLELGMDSCLAGVDGETSVERSGDGVAIPGSEVVITEAKPGGDLMLTIDSELQWYAQQVLAAEVTRLGSAYGHVTVMEAKTGKLLAVAEYPSVDPNSPSMTPEDMRGSRAFTAPFEPGSTMKPLTAAMLFDRGLTSVDEVTVTPDTFTSPDGAQFSDESAHEPRKYTTAGIISYSSNVGIALLGQRLSAADRYSYLQQAGLGQPTEAGFLGEESGTLHPYESWDPQTNYATMFGQALTVTGPQMASIYQTFANGGVRQPVKLADGCRDEDGAIHPLPGQEDDAPRQVISADAANKVLQTLEATAQHGMGNQVAIPGYRVGVKTGTAQFVGEDGSYVANKYILSMAGIAPIDDPQFVVQVTMMPPATMGGSILMAPTWHDVMAHALQIRSVPPSPEPWPDIPVDQQ